jgi:hypothetical protein
MTAALAAAMIAASGLPAGAVDLVGHRATYALSLAPGNTNSGVTGADGIMVYDLKDVCDGWATDLKLKVIISLDNGESRTWESSQVTWEAKNGSAYRFMIKNDIGGEAADETRGEARTDHGTITVTTDLPSKAEMKLPPDTLFPMAQTKAMLEKAAGGESVFTVDMFDGTAATQALQESAAMGAPQTGWAPGDKFPELKNVVSYPVDIAFYTGDQTEAVPISEQHIRLYANGVSGQVDFALGQVKIRALLDQFALQKPSGC